MIIILADSFTAYALDSESRKASFAVFLGKTASGDNKGERAVT